MKWNGPVCVNKRTRKVHKKDQPGAACRITQIERGNKLVYKDLETAANSGYDSLCDRCFPKLANQRK